MITWAQALSDLPLVAILRGIRTDEVDAVVGALVTSGFRLIEIPLNSPDAFVSIERAAGQFGADAVIGAGTVLTAADVDRVAEAGGRLIVAPNLNEEVAKAARRLDLIYCPGVMTPTEAFRAVDLGAAAIKLFPAELIPPAGVKAMMAVVPKSANLLAVGGITPTGMVDYLAAGAVGFGLGSALYRPGKSAADVAAAATDFVVNYRSIQPGT